MALSEEELLKREKQLKEREASLDEESEKRKRQQIKTYEELTTALDGYKNALDRNVFGEETAEKTRKRQLDLTKEFIERKIRLGQLEDEEYQKAIDRYNQLKKQVDADEELNKQEERRLKNIQGMSEAMGNLAEKIVGANNASTKFFVGLASLNFSLKDTENITKLSAEALQVFGTALINIGLIPFRQTYELLIEMNKELAARVRESTYVLQYGMMDSMYQASLGMSKFGIVAKDIMKDFYGLKDSSAVAYNQISSGNMAAAQSMAETSAKFTRLGVDASQTGRIIDTFVISIHAAGSSSKSINESLEQFANTAIGIGVPLRKFAADFETAMPRLAAQGSRALEIFTDLEKQSKKLGVEFNSLLGITEKFDTFEGAAQAAGSLNAILGGDYMNALQMLNADEATRIRLMKQSLDESGRTFDSLDKYSKKAIATALGINDINQANKIFSNSQNENTIINQKFNDVLERSATLGEKFDAAMKKLALTFEWFLGVAEKAVAVLDWIFSLFADLPTPAKFVLSLTLIAAGMGLVYLSFNLVAGATSRFITSAINSSTVLQDVASNTSKMSNAMNEAGKAGNNAAGGMQQSGNAAGGAWKNMVAFGVAVLLIGAGIGLAAWGLSTLVAAFKGLGDAAWPATVAVIGFTVAFGLLIFGLMALVAGPQAALAAGAVGVLNAIGFAALMIGLGMGIASIGIALMVKSIGDLDGMDLGSIATNLIKIAYAFTVLSVAGIAGLFGFIGLRAMFSSLSSAIESNIETFDKFATALDKIKGGLDAIKSISSITTLGAFLEDREGAISKNFSAIVAGLKSVNDTMGQMDFEKLDKLNTTIGANSGADKFITQVNVINDAKVSSVTSLLRAAAEFNNSARASSAAASKDASDAATKLLQAISQNYAQESKPPAPVENNFEIKIKESVLAKFILKTVDGRPAVDVVNAKTSIGP